MTMTSPRTPSQRSAFLKRARAGLAYCPTDMSRIEWGYRRDIEADKRELYPAPEKPAVFPHRATQGHLESKVSQLRGEVNFLNNKVTEMRAERKKKDERRYEKYGSD